MRSGTIHRVTGETDVRVTLGLDGTGTCSVRTGVPFLDHQPDAQRRDLQRG